MKPKGPLRVARVRSSWERADGTTGSHESVLLRQSWRDGKQVKHETVLSLTGQPKDLVDSLEQVLNHGARPAGEGPGPGDVVLGRGLRHGDVAAVWQQARLIGLPQTIGPAGRPRDIVLGLIAARICQPASKSAQTLWWDDTTLAEDAGLAGVSTDEVYEAMDWLQARKTQVEKNLAARWLSDRESNPAGLVLYDLTSTWMEGSHCELAKHGYSRDGKRSLPQIEFAFLANPDGIPVALRLFAGNTADPEACKQAITAAKTEFGMDHVALVGDRGMVTGTRIDDLKKDGMEWIGALKHAQIAGLIKAGDLEPSLFDEEGIAAIESPDYPGERLICCRNPARGEKDKAVREKLLRLTLELLDEKIAARLERGTLKGEGPVMEQVGKHLNRYKVGRLINVEYRDGALEYGRDQAAVRQAEQLDGLYAIRTNLPPDAMTDRQVLAGYKSLSGVEKDFAWVKGIDCQVRPIRHWKADRVEAHLMICQLAAIVAWHLRRAWAPLTYRDETPPAPADSTPVHPAQRSPQATLKARTRTTGDGRPAHTFHSLLTHLGTLQRVPVTIPTPAGPITTCQLTDADPITRQAFHLIGARLPITLPRP